MIRFRIDALSTRTKVLADQMPPVLNAAMRTRGSQPVELAPEFKIDVGGLSRMDRLAPKIVELREQGVPWNEIARITGLGAGNAWTVWQRWIVDNNDDLAVA